MVDAYEEDFYYDSVFKPDIKHDSGSTQFKKVPLHKVTLETEIPDEPQEKHDKPNDSHYEKELKKIDEQIQQHKDEKQKIYEQIKEERQGKNPEVKKSFEEIDRIKAEIQPLDEEIKRLNQDLTAPLAESKLLKQERDRLERIIDVKNYAQLQAEIKNIQQKLGYSSLSVTEEKKLIEKKARLESQAPNVKKYNDVRDKIGTINKSNETAFAKLKDLNKKKSDLITTKKKLGDKLNVLKASVEENKTVITQLEERKKSIQNAINELYNKRTEVKAEWDDKWYKFEKYMSIVEYIREAKKKQNDIRKREEKRKKKEEKDAEKGNTVGNVEINIVVSNDTQETLTCKRLIDFFNNLLPREDDNQNVNQNSNQQLDPNSKLSLDIKKGLIKPMDNSARESEQVLGIGGDNAGKKKQKKNKVSKREQKLQQSDLLVLDIDITGDIKKLNLKAPNFKNEIPTFLKTLDIKLNELRDEIGKVVEKTPEVQTEEVQA